MNKFSIDKIEQLQKEVNNGNGLDCVNTILFFLKNKQENKAIICIQNEWDKISGYLPLYLYFKDFI